MRRLYKYAVMMAVAVFAAGAVASCSDDDTKEKPKAPSLEIGAITVNDSYEATTTLTASKGTTAVYWGYAEGTAEPSSYTKAEGGGK